MISSYTNFFCYKAVQNKQKRTERKMKLRRISREESFSRVTLENIKKFLRGKFVNREIESEEAPSLIRKYAQLFSSPRVWHVIILL
jgi:hypothetical protein